MMKMKGLFMAIALILCIGTVNAQMGEWKEMDDYHMVMSMTFHPAEDGDLKPIMAESSNLALKAVAWKKSTIPAKFNKPEVKKSLALLVKESKALDKMVKKNKPETEIKQALFTLHDRFHEIMEKCQH